MVDIREAHAHFYEMLQQVGLEPLGWRVEWDRARHRAGACFHHKKTLVFSARAVTGYSWREVEQLFLHEAAHALVGPGGGHGHEWYATAKELGYKGEELVRDWDTDEKRKGRGEGLVFVLSLLCALWLLDWHTAFWALAAVLVTALVVHVVSTRRPVLRDSERHEIEGSA